MRDSIPICRSILKHWIFEDAEYLKVWLAMLAKARYIREPKKIMYQGTLHEVNYGEFIFGRPTWSNDLKISENRLRKLMNLLVEENMIELVKKTGKSTIYRITNYEKFNQQDNQEQDQEYQDVEEFDNQQDNQQITDRPPTDNQQTTNNEEGIRKIKKVKNKYGNFKNVLLTEDELFKLENEYGVGDTKTAIEYLSAYIEEKGYKSKSHNLAIRRWVFEASMNKKNKPKEQLPERKLAVL